MKLILNTLKFVIFCAPLFEFSAFTMVIPEDFKTQNELKVWRVGFQDDFKNKSQFESYMSSVDWNLPSHARLKMLLTIPSKHTLHPFAREFTHVDFRKKELEKKFPTERDALKKREQDEHEDFWNNELSQVNFSAAILSGANFEGRNLSQGDFRLSDLSSSSLKDTNLEGANFMGSDLRGSNLKGANLSNSNLRWANFFGSEINDKTNFKGADLRDVLCEENREGLSEAAIKRGCTAFHKYIKKTLNNAPKKQDSWRGSVSRKMRKEPSSSAPAKNSKESSESMDLLKVDIKPCQTYEQSNNDSMSVSSPSSRSESSAKNGNVSLSKATVVSKASEHGSIVFLRKKQRAPLPNFDEGTN